MCNYFAPRESLKQKALYLLKYDYSEQYIDAVLLTDGRYSISDVRKAIEEAKDELKNSR
ncbi:MAG: hypothetical protein JXA77_11325 [Bacteroidales bacterium]|nr:hypothetical protein [Bacteroidales bacterium]